MTEEKYLITTKQIDVLRCINDFVVKNGYCPSYRDMCAGTGIKSTSTVKYIVDFLAEAGYIKRPAGRAFRSVAITDSGIYCLQENFGWETTQATI